MDATWWNSIYRIDKEPKYRVVGDVPGLRSESSPNELLIFVHGWLADAKGAIGVFEEARKALRRHSYQYPVIGYSWDSDTTLHQWWAATGIAERNGEILADFTNHYLENNPGTNIRFVAHSLGARVALEALKDLNQREKQVKSVGLLGAAANTRSTSREGRYGEAIHGACSYLDNYHKPDDSVLGWMYTLGEMEYAVGQIGVRGTPPDNYTDIRARQVTNHLTYFTKEEGCIRELVDNFN